MDRDGLRARPDHDWQQTVVHTLCDSPILYDRNARAMLAELIGEELGRPVVVREQATLQLHMLELVRFCIRAGNDGLSALSHAVSLLEGHSRTAETVSRLVREFATRTTPAPAGAPLQQAVLPGWYSDPGRTSDGPATERWWDGRAWTDQIRPVGPAAAGAPVRFLVSCVVADRSWADWTAWQLENAGLRVLVLEGNASIGPRTEPEQGERVIALLSPAYIESVQVLRPWWVVHQEDPEGLADTLVPVVVQPCRPEWPLSQVPYTDLTGLGEDEARARLLHAVGATPTGRAGPAASPPSFPDPAGRR